MSPNLLTVLICGCPLWFKVQLLLLIFALLTVLRQPLDLSGSLVNLKFIIYKSYLFIGIYRMVVLNDT